ncbi:MAG: nitroreductase family deazaflavin-dependent oxidoreductase [Actinomycetota bacterium]
MLQRGDQKEETVSDWNAGIIQEFRDNEGVVGGYFEGKTLLLLTSTGAKTGNKHTTPLACYRDGDAWVVIASANGSDTHPAWYHNLRANPQAHIEAGTESIDVEAAEATGEERDRLYAGMVGIMPQFAEYETKTARKIPVFRLTQR